MANTLRFKRGLVATIPTAVAGEPLFTIDTFDLYIGNGTTNTRFQKYIASGTTSQLLRGDGSLLTMPIVLTSPSNGQVLKYNGTNWVNDSDAGVTGSGTTNYLPKWTSGSALGNSNLINDASGNLGLGVTPSAWGSDFKGIDIAGTTASFISSSSRNISASNTFYNGTSYIYKNSDFALMYWLDRPTGQYRWYNAPSGTAGNAISFTQAMTLGTNSGLSIGTTTAAPSNGLLVAGAATFSSTVTVSSRLTLNGVGTSEIYTTDASGLYLTAATNGGMYIASESRFIFRKATSPFTEYMRIESTGNVGIGTSSPSTRLEVNQSADSVIGFILTNPSGRAARFGYSSTFQLDIGSQSNDNIRFGNFGIGSGILSFLNNGTEAMRITSGGNLLVGTTTDNGSRFQVSGAATFSSSVTATNYLMNRGGGQWNIIPSSGANYLYFQENTGNKYIMTLDGVNQRVGIGTTSPSYKLVVRGESSTHQKLAITRVASDVAALFLGSNSSEQGMIAANSADLLFGTDISNTFTERLRITSGGNVGIGNTSASAKLHVTGNILSYTEAANTASLFISANNSYNWQFGIGNNSNFVITEGGGLNAIGTERLRITSGGNVGINTSSPSYKLDVNGGIYGKGLTADSDGGVGNALYAYNQVLSGSSTNALIQLATTWNTTGNANAIDLNVTNTASGASSKLINLKVDNATMFNVSKGGAITTAAPTGYAAKPYKLGEVLTGATIADRSIAVEIDGTVYFLLASTTAP